MIKQIFSILIVILLSFNHSIAQFSITGKLVDSRKEAVSFANVLLFSEKDSTFIKGGVSDETGSFYLSEIAPASYFLNISFLGYEEKYIATNLIASLELGEILLEEKVTELKEVTVAAKRKLISKKIDRLVFDVENSSKASQGDALEVLSVTPGVRVRNESVSMIGKSNVAVMINDKMIRLSNEELSSFLKSISSEDIKKIEVITAPPSKYEAEGNSGLINIQLKKGIADSWNVSLRGDLRQRTNSRVSGGIGSNYNKNKWSIASSLYYQGGIYQQVEEHYTHFPDGLWFTNSTFDRAFDEGSGRIDLGYQLAPNWLIGSQYIYSFSDQKTSDTPYTSVSNPQTNHLLEEINSIGKIDQLRHIHSFNFYNQIQLDTTGKSVNINLDYFNFDDWEDKKYEGNLVRNSPFWEQYFAGVNTNQQVITNVSSAIDFKLPYQFAELEIGGKYTHSKSSNNLDFYNSGLTDNPIIDLSIAKNDFEYIENIHAAYISGSKQITEKIAVKAGVRVEATKATSKSNNLNFNKENDYIKLFPTFYLGYTPSKQMTTTFSYNKRISRAPFYMLTPNPWVANPFQSVVGNPFLQPSFADNFELNAVYKNVTVSLYFNKEKDVFTQVPIPDANNTSVEFKFENFLDIQRTGINFSYLIEKSSWWTSSNSIDFNHTINRYKNDGKRIEKSGYMANLSTSNDFYLNKKRTLLFHLSYWYSPRGVDEIWDIEPMSNLSASIQYLLLDKRLKLTFRANDILKTQKERITTTLDGTFQKLDLYYDSRYIGVVVSYSFGNTNLSTKKNKVGNQAERNRAGRF